MKNRLVIAIENTPISVRVMPHKDEPTKLVLKATNNFAAGELCGRLGVPVLKAYQGSSFFITEVWRATFFERFAAAGMGLLDAQEPPKALAMAGVETGLDLGEKVNVETGETTMAMAKPAKCGECGCSDGMHWNFCPNGKVS